MHHLVHLANCDPSAHLAQCIHRHSSFAYHDMGQASADGHSPRRLTSWASGIIEGQRGLSRRQTPQHIGALGHGGGSVVMHLL